uniref:Uncharacterized protein n=2 Tax=Schistocephalus solidus TaxID=70667 RepID=A0A0X3PH94_SCHSO
MSDFLRVPEIQRCASPIGDCGTNDPRYNILRETYSINGSVECDRSESFWGNSNLISESFEQTVSGSSLSSQQMDEHVQVPGSGDKPVCLSCRRDTLTQEDSGAINARENEFMELPVLNQRNAGAVVTSLPNCRPHLLDLRASELEPKMPLQDHTPTDSGFAGCNSLEPTSISSISCPTESPTHLVSPRQLSEDAYTDNQSPSALKAVGLHQQLTRLHNFFETLQRERLDLESRLERTKE